MRAVIFDLGNVLIHYDHRATLHALAAVSAADEAALGALLSEFEAEYGTGSMSSADLHEALTARAGASRDFARFAQAFSAGLAPDEEALAYALALQARPDMTVAVISNTNALHVAWLDAHVAALAEFDLVIMSNEVGMLKPDPGIFALALELLNLPPEDALFVDDAVVNVEAARSLGMAGIVHRDWTETRVQLAAWLGD
ncbi:MAG: HAD-IA family hydrolase [Caldilineaceae bacterium]|nr:HAD-IA family hydrolase [Caldilineaceae bacterium]